MSRFMFNAHSTHRVRTIHLSAVIALLGGLIGLLGVLGAMKIQTAQPPAFYEQRFVNGNSTIVVIGGLDTTSYSEQNQAEEWWRARHPEEYIFNCRHQAHTSRVCDVYRKVP